MGVVPSAKDPDMGPLYKVPELDIRIAKHYDVRHLTTYYKLQERLQSSTP